MLIVHPFPTRFLSLPHFLTTLDASWHHCQAPLSMEFSRQGYWSGVPFPSPGDLPKPGIEPTSPALAGGFFTTEPLGSLYMCMYTYIYSFSDSFVITKYIRYYKILNILNIVPCAINSYCFSTLYTIMSISQSHCFCSVVLLSVAQLCPTLCNPKDCSMPGFPVLHHLLELAQTHVH